MRKLFISSDSTADLTLEMQSETAVSVIPFSARICEFNVPDCIKTPDETKNLLFLAEEHGFKIIPPTVAEYENFFDDLADKGGDILHIACGSMFSKAYSNALKASRNTMVKFRKSVVYVLDSHALGAGQALILDHALSFLHKSLSPEEIYVNLTETARRVEQYFILPSVKNYNTVFPSAASVATKKAGFVNLIAVDDSGMPMSPRKTASFATACKTLAASYNAGNYDRPVYVYGATDVGLLLKAVSALRRRGCQNINMNSLGLCNCLMFGGSSVSAAFIGSPKKSVVKAVYSPGKESDFLPPDED